MKHFSVSRSYCDHGIISEYAAVGHAGGGTGDRSLRGWYNRRRIYGSGRAKPETTADEAGSHRHYDIKPTRVRVSYNGTRRSALGPAVHNV